MKIHCLFTDRQVTAVHRKQEDARCCATMSSSVSILSGCFRADLVRRVSSCFHRLVPHVACVNSSPTHASTACRHAAVVVRH